MVTRSWTRDGGPARGGGAGHAAARDTCPQLAPASTVHTAAAQAGTQAADVSGKLRKNDDQILSIIILNAEPERLFSNITVSEGGIGRLTCRVANKVGGVQSYWAHWK